MSFTEYFLLYKSTSSTLMMHSFKKRTKKYDEQAEMF